MPSQAAGAQPPAWLALAHTRSSLAHSVVGQPQGKGEIPAQTGRQGQRDSSHAGREMIVGLGGRGLRLGANRQALSRSPRERWAKLSQAWAAARSPPTVEQAGEPVKVSAAR